MAEIMQASLAEAFELTINRLSEGNWLIVPDAGSHSGILLKEDSEKYAEYERVFNPGHHDFLEACICVAGSCAIQQGDRIFEIKEGNALIILPGTVHNELARKNWSYSAIWIGFRTDIIRMHLSGKTEQSGFFTNDGYSLKTSYEHNFILSNIKAETDSNRVYRHELLQSYMLQLIVFIYRTMREARNDRQTGGEWKEAVALEVQKYIEKNYSRHIRLEDICQEICVSANHLNSIFKSITGRTIMQYLEAYRIDRAKLFLENSQESISNISDRLGYYDQYHFSKTFKKETGYTPTRFRKMTNAK